ncbi:MAG: hypothetical protein DRN25_07775, partial [Thermoplasmata archaeon]
VASCSPRTHEELFRNTLKKAGLNKYLFEMANIREHVSWVHAAWPEEATEKAKDLVKMAVAKARLLEPLEEYKVKVFPSVLVIGGGVAGLTAALCIANLGFKVYLVEKSDELGGITKKLYKIYPDNINGKEFIDILISKVRNNKNIEIFTSSNLEEVEGYIGNFKVKVNGKELKVGCIIVATGASILECDTGINLLELEELLKEGKIKRKGKYIFILCSGARNELRPYCSRICCVSAIKNALEIKKIDEKNEVLILYKDIRTFGYDEALYLQALESGIKFLRYENINQIRKEKDRYVVEVFSPLFGETVEICAEEVIHSTPLIAKNAQDLSKMLKVPLDQNGFFLEAHPKLRPLEFQTRGIYLCGSASFPKSVGECIAHALGAASKALTLLIRGFASVEGTIATVNEELCVGCGICTQVCPYSVPKLVINDQGKIVSYIEKIMCRGCGICAADCPFGAIEVKHFTNKQEIEMIKAISNKITTDEIIYTIKRVLLDVSNKVRGETKKKIERVLKRVEKKKDIDFHKLGMYVYELKSSFNEVKPVIFEEYVPGFGSIEIDAEKCIGCMKCEICPTNAIKLAYLDIVNLSATTKLQEELKKSVDKLMREKPTEGIINVPKFVYGIGKPIVSEPLCIACKLCSTACPVDAIKMKTEWDLDAFVTSSLH